MSNSILLTDPREIAAVQNGEIDGERYTDGETYGDVISLLRWRNEQPLTALEADVRTA